MKNNRIKKINEFLETENIKNIFSKLSSDLNEEVILFSSSSDIKNSENYSKIKSLGKPAIPFIIEKIKNKEHISYFMLLNDIIGDVGMPNSISGNLNEMSKFYLKWVENNVK